MDRGHNVICVLTTEDLLRGFSVGEMHHIRQIMIQHEELFKEQVRTLHKLYQVQKSAMHDIERILFLQNGTPNGKVCNPLFVRKPTTDYNSIYGLNYKKANYPLLDGEAELAVAKEYLDVTYQGHEYSPDVQKRKIRKIDLEKPPEEYMDEVDSPFEQNSCVGDSQGFQQDLLEKFQYNSSLSVGRGAVCEESKIPLNTGNPIPLPIQPLYPLDIGIRSSDLQTEDQSRSSHHSSTTAKFDGQTVAGKPDKFNISKILVPDNAANSRKCGTMCESALEDSVKLDQARFSFEKEAQPSGNARQNTLASCANMGNIAEDSEISSNDGHKNTPELVPESKNLESETNEEGLAAIGNAEKFDNDTSKEECDTIAANILLSFITFQSDISPKMQGPRPQAEAKPTAFDNDAKDHHGKKFIKKKEQSCIHVENDNVVRSRRSRPRRRNKRG